MTERSIASPDGVDSLERLGEWLSSCGMPQFGSPQEFNEWAKPTPIEPRKTYHINHEKIVVSTAKNLANTLYSRFCEARYSHAIWRHRPALTDSGVECRLGFLVAKAA